MPAKFDDSALADLLAELRAQTALLEKIYRAVRPSAADEETADVLRAINMEIGNVKFTVAELKEHLPFAPELTAALMAVHGEINGQKIGWLLSGAEGKNYSGIVVERVRDDDREGITRRVLRV